MHLLRIHRSGDSSLFSLGRSAGEAEKNAWWSVGYLLDMFIWGSWHVYIYVYVYVYRYLYIYIFIGICIQTHIYIYTHLCIYRDTYRPLSFAKSKFWHSSFRSRWQRPNHGCKAHKNMMARGLEWINVLNLVPISRFECTVWTLIFVVRKIRLVVDFVV